jgi:hypothetical protein
MTDRDRIRELLCEPADWYEMADALRLTHATEAEVRLLLCTDNLTVSREQVVELAVRRWTPRMIETALRATGRFAFIPFLNRMRHIEVSLPLYQIRLLHYLAERGGGTFRARLNVSDVLEHHLLDLASAVQSDVVERKIPGFCDALQYPGFNEPDPIARPLSCMYCGRLKNVRRRGVCAACRARHEPAIRAGLPGYFR